MVKDVNTLQKEIIQKITYNFLLIKMPTIKIFKQKVVLKIQQWGGLPAAVPPAAVPPAAVPPLPLRNSYTNDEPCHLFLFIFKQV